MEYSRKWYGAFFVASQPLRITNLNKCTDEIIDACPVHDASVITLCLPAKAKAWRCGRGVGLTERTKKPVMVFELGRAFFVASNTNQSRIEKLIITKFPLTLILSPKGRGKGEGYE